MVPFDFRLRSRARLLRAHTSQSGRTHADCGTFLDEFSAADTKVLGFLAHVGFFLVHHPIKFICSDHVDLWYQFCLMKSRILLQCVIFLCVSLTSVWAQAQDGEYLFKTYCAICHEPANGEEARGPSRDVFKQMTAEHILDVLEKGSMKAQAAERSRIQRHILAEYLSRKALGSAPLDLIPKSAFCNSNAANFNNSPAGPSWNGWGATITNRRFQSAQSAGLP